MLSLLLVTGCATGRRVKCQQADPAPALPVVVHYVAEWDDGDGASAHDLRFAAWSDGAIVTLWFDESDGLSYFVGHVSPASVQALVEEIASFGVFDLPGYQFGIDHGDEEGVWIRCGDDAVRLDGVRFPTSTFTSSPEREHAFREFLNARTQTVLSIAKFDNSLDFEYFAPIREQVDATGAFRGFNPERPSSFSWSWAENDIWRIER